MKTHDSDAVNEWNSTPSRFVGENGGYRDLTLPVPDDRKNRPMMVDIARRFTYEEHSQEKRPALGHMRPSR